MIPYELRAYTNVRTREYALLRNLQIIRMFVHL